jgi:hypothetical protein
MHFNTKYIFQGDSKSEALAKINYNFDQIVSFGVGPNGNRGAKGATGIYGPAGFKGISGTTGGRASKWYSQSTQPAGSQQYDLWIDSNTADGVVNQKGSTGSWNDTGYRLFSSLYFKSYEFIKGPAGVTDKYVIGLNNVGASAAYTNIVISDADMDITDINPNNSKVLVSTDDQITSPVMGFSKSGAISGSRPSFYWKNTGMLGDLEFRTGGIFRISSNLSTSINTGTSRLNISGNRINSTSLNYTISGVGNFDIGSNNTVGAGTFFNVNSSNLVFNQIAYDHLGSIVISAATGSYLLNNTPTAAFAGSNIELEVGSLGNSMFEFTGIGGGNILSAKPRGSVSSGNFAQTIFGSTGGATGGTGGPYSYHVRRLQQIRQNTINVNSVTLYRASFGSTANLTNVFDLRNLTFWESDVIVATPLSYTSAGGVYLYVPADYTQSIYPIYSYNRSRTFRVMLDNTETNPTGRNILGLIIDFSQFISSIGTVLKTYISFPSTTCQYVDITWLAYANANNANTRLFWKTCDGRGGYLDLTNLYSVGVEPPPSSGTVGGTVPSSGGSVPSGGAGCPTPDMPIMISPELSILAGDLEIGNEIYTIHEISNEWGYYKVSYIETTMQPIVSVNIGGKILTVSDTHKFLLSSGDYVSVSEIEIGTEIKTMNGTSILESVYAIGNGEVLKIEIEEAHTYVIDGVISHNKIVRSLSAEP